MDAFVRFNRKSIDDRQVDTLIGLSKGMLADGVIEQSEAEFLFSWLVQSRQATDNPIILNLLSRVSAMLEDGSLDRDESGELLRLLRKISGKPSEFGELAKSATLPLDTPAPPLTFAGNSFLFTGTCAFGTRKQCQHAISALGGRNARGVTKTLDYLILGTYVTDSWAHETYGRKIEKAMRYRDEGQQLAIISEEYWAETGKLIQAS